MKIEKPALSDYPVYGIMPLSTKKYKSYSTFVTDMLSLILRRKKWKVPKVN